MQRIEQLGIIVVAHLCFHAVVTRVALNLFGRVLFTNMNESIKYFFMELFL